MRHKGKDISDIAVRDRSAKQISSLQMVFQNPFDTLNPSHSIGGQISRVIKKFGVETDKKKIFDRVMKLLDTVKLPRDFYFQKAHGSYPAGRNSASALPGHLPATRAWSSPMNRYPPWMSPWLLL